MGALAMLLPLISQAVPAIAKVFTDDGQEPEKGSAADTAIKMATGAIKSITGTDELADGIAQVQANPDMFAKFKAEMNRHTEAVLDIHARDRKDARNMLVKLAQAGSWLQCGPIVISAIVTLGFFAMLYMVFNKTIPDGSDQLAFVLLGGLGAAFHQVVNFWCGSSKSSQDKTQLLAPNQKKG